MLQAFSQEKAIDWYKFGENCNLSSDLVLSRDSIGRQFYDYDLAIASLVSDPFLNHHQMGYSDQRPYESIICGKDLTQNIHLIPHERTQMGERISAYAESGKSFNHGMAITIQNRINTVEKPYECHQCGKVFNRRHSLSEHQSGRNYMLINSSFITCLSRWLQLHFAIVLIPEINPFTEEHI